MKDVIIVSLIALSIIGVIEVALIILTAIFSKWDIYEDFANDFVEKGKNDFIKLILALVVVFMLCVPIFSLLTIVEWYFLEDINILDYYGK